MPETGVVPQLHRRWLHASGGLTWHLRALRYRDSLWRDFRQTVRSWLHDWQPPVEKLLIVGPSAGHTLDNEFLGRWREVTILEPDPLARWLLRRRYPDINWRAGNLDVLNADGSGFGLLARHYADHAVLFANVLGQMAPREERHAQRWFAALRAGLHGLHWASYHDVISTERVPDAPESSATLSGTSLDEVIGHFWHGGELEIVDHCTFGLGRAGGHTGAYCIWPLRPGHHHLVEWQVEAPHAPSRDGSNAATDDKAQALAAALAGKED